MQKRKVYLGFGEQTIAPLFREGGNLYVNPNGFVSMRRNETLPMEHNYMHAPPAAYQNAMMGLVDGYDSERSTDSKENNDDFEEVDTQYNMPKQSHTTLKSVLTQLDNILSRLA